jgi:hypothetical protein
MPKSKGPKNNEVTDKALAKAKSAKELSPEEKAQALQAAIELDKSIDNAIDKLGREVAEAYVNIGKQLSEMRSTKGYKLLGRKDWVDYLEGKESRLRKTYCYYVIRLAEAEGLNDYYDVLSGAQFIEYAKLVKAEKLPLLMADTVGKVKGESARETAKLLTEHIKKNPGKYKDIVAVERKGGGKKAAPWADKFKKQHESAKDKDAFIKGMEEYLKAMKAAKK